MTGGLRGLARRRMFIVPVIVLTTVMVLAMVITVAIAVFTAPAAAPVAVAATVLGSAVEVFGTGDGGQMSGTQLAEAASQGDVTCDLAPAADPPAVTTTPAAPSSETATEAAGPAVSSDSPPERPKPISLDNGGSISREDAALLLAPLEPGSSTLKAHVWFLYRMAGLGDWDRFTAAYAAAGLRGDEDSPDAPLRQVQALNTVVSDMERYRLTAAALAAAGEQTGRFTDPYPRYREMVAIELMSSCMTGTGAEGERMTLPADGDESDQRPS